MCVYSYRKIFERKVLIRNYLKLSFKKNCESFLIPKLLSKVSLIQTTKS